MRRSWRTRGRRAGGAVPVRPVDDAGFTLVELMVSSVVIGILMSSLTFFFLTAISVSSRQRQSQTAGQIAATETDRVRSMDADSLVKGRTSTSASNQWSNRPAPVKAWVPDSLMKPAYDNEATGSSTAALSLAPQPRPVDQLQYSVSYYVGWCWQPLAGTTCTSTVAAVPFVRVVIVVTWPDRGCSSTGGSCYHVSSTLVTRSSVDPVFR